MKFSLEAVLIEARPPQEASLTYDLSWRMVHVYWKRMHVLLPLDGIFCMSIRSIWLKSNISLLTFCLDDPSTVGSGVMKVSTTIEILCYVVYLSLYIS